jgi:hypothetical protein
MNKYIKNSFLCVVIFLLSVLSSCVDDNTYSVPDEFKSYVENFVSEAAKRGKTYDFTKTGLIIEFADLKDNVAGLCHYEDPIRIEVDRTYWEEIGETAGAELMQENIIFHELGHGILGREHDNSILENGDWKTIMCGGDKVNDRAWNINYRGIRREYYIDELFDSSTSAPEFSSLLLIADTTGYEDKILLSFDTEAKAGWKIGDYDTYKTSIDDGKLKFASKLTSTYVVMASTPLDIQSDFIFECSMQINTDAANSDQFGLIFGNMSGVDDAMEFLTVNKEKHFYTGNTNWYSYYTELSCSDIVSNGLNQLKVVKSGDMLYYFINNVYVYEDNMETTVSGNYFGFMVPPLGTVWLDNLRIAIKGSASSAIKQNAAIKDVEFQVMEFNRNTGLVVKPN